MKKQPGPITQILTKDPNADIRNYLPLARRLLSENNPKDAIRLACAVLSVYLNNPDAWNIIFCACVGRKLSFVKFLLGTFNANFAFPKYKIQNIPSWMADHGHLALAWEKLLDFFREREDIVMVESVLKILVHAKNGSVSSLVNLAEFLVIKSSILPDVTEKGRALSTAIALLEKAIQLDRNNAEVRKMLTDAMASKTSIPWEALKDADGDAGSYLNLVRDP